MFTGIIEKKGTVTRIERKGMDFRLDVAAADILSDVMIGDSIAVNGVCLTVTTVSASAFSADVSAETISRTTLSLLARGSVVNLERALTPTSRLGGHFVLGHIDCVGQIVRKAVTAQSIQLDIDVEKEYGRYLVEKGSIAVDGVSLTINACDGVRFSVNIIPHTAAATTLDTKGAGDRVNIETDILGKYVERYMNPDKTVDKDLLRRHGFIE